MLSVLSTYLILVENAGAPRGPLTDDRVTSARILGVLCARARFTYTTVYICARRILENRLLRDSRSS